MRTRTRCSKEVGVSQQKQTILIVDDKPGNLHVLAQTLSELDVEIVRAHSGNEALAATLDHAFALCILDVQMPGMDGYEVAQLLRGEPRTQFIPIIFLTAALSEQEEILKGYEAGGVDYIVKPFLPLILLSKVKIFLELDRQKLELIEQREQLEALTGQLQEEIRNKEEKERHIRRQSEVIRELSTPILQVWEGILLVPLVGSHDPERVERLTAKLLDAVHREQPKVIILDVTGMPQIDGSIVGSLLRMVDAARLLGPKCVFTGIGPENARSLIRQGVDLAGITAERSMHAGLECALRWVESANGPDR